MCAIDTSWELTMTDPAQVQRGAVALTTALRISTLLPRERDAIFSILRTLNTADELMPRLAALWGSRSRPEPVTCDD